MRPLVDGGKNELVAVLFFLNVPVLSSPEPFESLGTLPPDSLSFFALTPSVQLDESFVRILSMSHESLLESGLFAARNHRVHDDVHVDDQDRKEKA